MAITHNEQAGQFELETTAGKAILRYVPRGDVRELTHTKVPESVEGRGHGTALVKGALDQLRAANLKVVPTCPFVKAFIEQNPDYADLQA